MKPYLLGLGSALPPFSLLQEESEDFNASLCTDSRDVRRLRAVYRRAGVAKRHCVLLEKADGPPFDRQSFYWRPGDVHDRGPSTAARMEHHARLAPPLAAEAARAALLDAGTESLDITHLVTVSCTGFHAPGLDQALVQELRLKPTVSRTHVGFQGCHAALNALSVASAFVEADPLAKVLVCAVELCTLHLGTGWQPEHSTANALFGDGAGAVVVGADEDGQSHFRLAARGSLLMPDSRDELCWTIGDHGFRMRLTPRVPKLIEEHLGGFVDEWLFGHGLSREAIASWAIHPGGPRILDACARALQLEDDALDMSQSVLRDSGNMSSATLLFILKRMQEQHRESSRTPIVALGFGPGMVCEAMLLT